MKRIIYILISTVFITFSCGKDILDLTPQDRLSDDAVWGNVATMQMYLNDVYQKLPFNNRMGPSERYLDVNTEIGTRGTSTPIIAGGVSRTHDPLPFWSYNIIRELNIFLEKLDEVDILQTAKDRFEGEARVLRAMVYYEKQIRYGGVPLVDIPLNPYEPIDQKYTRRSKEEEIADFIDADLEAAIPLLTENTRPLGRINKWSAYAFKARANLYSASIAKYGSVQINGLVGIPGARADEFYSKASAAANAVITSGKYELFDQNADKSENYRLLFVTDDNSEAIFSKEYDGVNILHNHNAVHLPQTLSGIWGAGAMPSYDYILSCEKIDGSTFPPDPPQIGPEHLYDYVYQAFEDRDPRIKAVAFFDGDVFAGREIRMYEGIDPGPVPNPDNILNNYGQTYEGLPQVAEDSRLIPFEQKRAEAGLIQKKYCNENEILSTENSNNWMELRLGEVYLVRAEAEFELGNLNEAANALNKTRARAGISLVDQATVTLDHIRTERMSELAFERQRWWDLRRWRIAEDVLNLRNIQGLRQILHYETGKFYLLPVQAEPVTRQFGTELYYNPITDARIDNNPDLEENPGY